jgi:hypothetical protein
LPLQGAVQFFEAYLFELEIQKYKKPAYLMRVME